MADSIIKSFLVRLGYKVDEDSRKKFLDSVERVSRSVTILGVETAKASVGVAAGIKVIAEQYAELYNASLRTGSSVAGLRAFEYGSKALGISAQQAQASLQSLNESMIFNPAKRWAIETILGVRTVGRETKDVMNDAVDALGRIWDSGPFGPGMAARLGQQFFGLSPSELKARLDNRADDRAAQARLEKMHENAGISKSDMQKLSYDSRHFTESLDDLFEKGHVGWTQVAINWLPVMQHVADVANLGADAMLRLGRASGGTTSIIAAFATSYGVYRLIAGALGAIVARVAPVAPIAAGAATGATAAASGAAGAAGTAAVVAGRTVLRRIGGMLFRWVPLVGWVLDADPANKGEVDLERINDPAERERAIGRMRGGMAPSPVGTDRDLMIRTVVGEAGNQSDAGKQAVAEVILNRLHSGRYGPNMSSVLFAPVQFEPWSTRRAELMGISTTSKAYLDAARAVDAAMSGSSLTGGALNFSNEGTVAKRGNRSALEWIQRMKDNGSAVRIGDHVFGNPAIAPPPAPVAGDKVSSVSVTNHINGYRDDPNKLAGLIGRSVIDAVNAVRNSGTEFA